jgi:hypothetical protein
MDEANVVAVLTATPVPLREIVCVDPTAFNELFVSTAVPVIAPTVVGTKFTA